MGLFKSIKKEIRIRKELKNQKELKRHKKQIQDKFVNLIFPDLTVKHGPFSGMKYSSASSVGSALFPKLLGSYESELSALIDQICNKEYSVIVDIGCAEGYYAVGLALKIKSAHIYAYDTSEKARALCHEMFMENMIDLGRYSINSLCTKDTLAELNLGKKALIVCDCEGCEKELLVENNLAAFKNHDLLIETHDCFDINISTNLYELFSNSHKITIVESIDDIQKVKRYQYKEVNGCTLEEKLILLGEQRDSIMEWFYLESKNNP